MIVTINSRGVAEMTGLCQWDVKQEVTVAGINLTDCTMHWSYSALADLTPAQTTDIRQFTEATVDDETVYTVAIPDSALQEAGTIDGYIYRDNADGGETIARVYGVVQERPQPSDYVSEDNITTILTLIKSETDPAIADMQEGIAEAIGAMEATADDLTGQVNAALDLSNAATAAANEKAIYAEQIGREAAEKAFDAYLAADEATAQAGVAQAAAAAALDAKAQTEQATAAAQAAVMETREDLYSTMGLVDPQPAISLYNGAYNGDFSDGTVSGSQRGGWIRNDTNTTLDITAGILTVTGNATSQEPFAYRTPPAEFTITGGDVLYFRARGRTRAAGATYLFMQAARATPTTTAQFNIKTSPVANTWYETSGLVTVPAGTPTGTMYVRFGTTWPGSEASKIAEYDYGVVINLSTAFGGTANIPAGLTAEIVDGWLTDKLGAGLHYFSGTEVFQRSRTYPDMVMTETAGAVGWKPVTDIYRPPLGFATEDYIADGAVKHKKTNFAAIGKNKFDARELLSGYYVSNTTTGVTAGTGWETSGYIPVKAGQAYTAAPVRYALTFAADKSRNGSRADSGNHRGTITITPAADGYLRISWLNTSVNASEVQVEEGSTATAYEPFSTVISDLQLTEAQIAKASKDTLKDIKINKTGTLFTMTSKLGAETIESKFQTDGSDNGAFSFVQTKIGSTIVAQNTDDIAPQRIQGYPVGANHRYPFMARVTATGHGKTTADIGSLWTDGTTQYTLLRINGSYLYFAPPYTTTNGEITAAYIAPVATLTHVGGATDATAVALTALTPDENTRYATNNISVKVYLDGTEITADGDYYGTTVDVRENYNVMCYKELLDFMQSHIGGDLHDNSIGGVYAISNTYTYTKGLACTIYGSLKALKKMTATNWDGIQAILLNSATTRRYLPNVKVKSGYDLHAGVDMSGWNQNVSYLASDLEDAAIPPNHYVEWIMSGGNKTYGFSAGYIPDKTAGANAARLASNTRLWYIPTFKKNYPTLMSKTMQAGDYFNFAAFRNYMTAAQAGNATAAFTVKDRASTYLFIVYNQAATAENVYLNEHIGKSVSVVQSRNFTLLNTVVDGLGVSFNITSTSGNAVLKIV